MLRIETIGTKTEKGTNYESIVQIEGDTIDVCQSVEATIEALVKAAEKRDRMLKFAVMGAISKSMSQLHTTISNDDIFDVMKEMFGIKEGVKC